ncbi:histone deacetylase [Imperialibacter roseus]|uniref:Histone deacetylase n=1 Tax=Imperialibacter roseus TaxID=1324217 RepID=A0ABZ0IV15_9BACT|nr:histone deacetylase [Imperialibacter roseus]WOK08824.1 histone deacetylase [Imperialibacter roseus]
MLRVAWSKAYNHRLPDKHRFPMMKYELLPEQLIYEGTIKEDQLFAPGLLQIEQILRAHDADYWRRLSSQSLSAAEIRKTGFPHSESLIERETNIAAGTVECCRFALQYGVSFNVAGGTHHAFTDRGEGFCLLNDMAIAASDLLANSLASKILIIDLDVHQGNGTAQIFTGNKQVFTLSMHGARNYPAKKEQSSLDIGLADGTDDKLYLKILEANLKSVLDDFQPDFAFYQAGVDVLATDKLGRLALSQSGCKERDRLVLQLCRECRLPVVVTMGGGYSEKINDIVEAHANTFRLAQDIYF